MKAPRALGLVLADYARYDPVTKQLSLFGIFHSRRLPGRPSPPQTFVTYAGLTGGEGEGTIELTVMHLESERYISRYRQWVRFPAGQPGVDLFLTLDHCVFPQSGRYHVNLRFEGTDLASFPLDIRLEEVSDA